MKHIVEKVRRRWSYAQRKHVPAHERHTLSVDSFDSTITAHGCESLEAANRLMRGHTHAIQGG